MARMRLVTILLCACVVTVAITPAQANWQLNGVPLSNAPGNQERPQVVSDDAGGAIIVWHDRRSGSYWDIYAQRIDHEGNSLWTLGGVAICTAAYDQTYPQIAPDGSGGAIITWQDYRPGTHANIHAQRVDADGNVLWVVDGVLVCGEAGNQDTPCIISDEAGGAIIAWQDRRVGNYDVFAQRIDGSGAAQWGAGGVALCTASNDQSYLALVHDGAGGAIATWRDYRSGALDIYAGHVTALGAADWSTNGVPICLAGNHQYGQAVCADGAGGAVIAWHDLRGGSYWDIYAQRVDVTGTTLWASNGALVSAASYNQTWPQLTSDGAGGAVITWFDSRSYYYNDIYAQRMDAAGNPVWNAHGVPVCTASYNQEYPTIASDGNGGAVITWHDGRTTYRSIYAQRLESGAGTPLWASNGMPVSSAPGHAYYPQLTNDNNGGLIITWYDNRAGTNDIYAQWIEKRYGFWGVPEPVVAAVEDVPGDQGGFVRLNWKASGLDFFNTGYISHYSVWRALDEVPPAMTTGAPALVEPEDIDKHFEGRAYRVEETSQGVYYWEWVANQDAYYLGGYSLNCPTVLDSSDLDDGMHYFQVMAHTENRFEFWTSKPDSGYSVDNLPPATPQNFVGQWDYPPGRLSLSWGRNKDPDVLHYAVHRGEGKNFTPNDGTCIAITPDTLLTGLSYYPVDPWHFKVCAVDIHGNTGGFAVLPPEYVPVPSLVRGYEAAWRGDAVEVRWIMGSVAGDYTFDVRRRVDGSDYEPLTAEVIRNDDEFMIVDRSAERGHTYAYRMTVSSDEGPLTTFETTVTTPVLRFALEQNHPNPFNPVTRISFTLERPGHTVLEIYDVSGKRVRTLVDRDVAAGIHWQEWDGRDEHGVDAASGVYFFRLRSGAKAISRKAVLLR